MPQNLVDGQDGNDQDQRNGNNGNIPAGLRYRDLIAATYF
jgi:hypothetical protein